MCLLIVVEREAAVGEADHAALVGELAGEQRGAARRARGRAREGTAEEDALAGEALEIGGRHGVAIGLEVAARVVRVEVEDVRRAARGRLGLRAGETRGCGKKRAAGRHQAHSTRIGLAMRRRDLLAMLLAAGSSDAAVIVDRRSRRVLAMRNEAVATRAALPPGSTMKPLTLAALMKNGKLRAKEAWPCPGTLAIGGRQLELLAPANGGSDDDRNSAGIFVQLLRRARGRASRAGRPPVRETDRGNHALRLQALGEDGVSFTVSELAEAYRQLAATAPPEIVAGMEGAVEYGTAQRAGVAGMKVAGKTGSVRTASAMRVAWFAGWTPEVVIAVRTQGMSGGADAAPVAAEMLRALR